MTVASRLLSLVARRPLRSRKFAVHSPGIKLDSSQPRILGLKRLGAAECGIIEQSFRRPVPTETTNTLMHLRTQLCQLAFASLFTLTSSRLYAQTSANAARAVTVHAQNGVELKATINGQGPFDAVFDTGSGNLMTASLATRLGLKQEGSATINAGGGAVPAKVVKVATINIGGLTMSDQLFAIVDTPLTQDQDGIFVGDLLLQNLPIRIDFEKQEITFYSKQGFKYAGNGTAVPIHSQDGTLLAEATVDGMDGLFGIDTGDMYSLSLFAPFVKQHKLEQHYGSKIQGYAGQGWGGADHGFYARVDTLRLGEISVVRPITVLSTDTQGAESSATVAGNIGLRVLRQFNLVFDSPHGKMYLEKNANYGKPDIFNRAGLLLDLNADNLKIMTVVPGSPGARAGLKQDDVITQIDGKTPTDDTMQSAFTQPVGTVVRMTVHRGAKVRNVSLVLKEIL
jgi:Aspartyl protease/PDZ domain